MRAAVVPGVGARWELREVPTPQPGPGQVLIEVRASGLCHNDLWLANGTYPFPKMDPVILGHEAAGDVVAVGAGVSSRQVGDRVGATWIQSGCGRCGYCRRNLPVTGQLLTSCATPVMTGMTAQGGHAQFVAVAAGSTVLLPDDVSYETAAPVMCAGYTAWCALRAADPKPHERVAVLGIGGLGHLALQFSRACGYETVAITHSPDKLEWARKLGADIVVGSGAELREVGGADVVLVTGTSNEAASDALGGMRPGGRMALAAIDPARGLTIRPEHFFWSRGMRLIGTTHEGLNYLTEALDLVASGAVTPVVEVYAADQIGAAVDRADQGQVRFRAVVTF